MHEAENALIASARGQGRTNLTEHEGKRLLAGYGVPVVEERLVTDLAAAKAAAQQLGYPVALKVCAAGLAHKTESGLVALRLRDERDLEDAFRTVSARIPAGIPDVTFLVQKMVGGARELIVGMMRDPQFGPAVMFGLGGIFAEALSDVAFRLVPLSPFDTCDMIDEIEGRAILGAIRGMAPVNRGALIKSVMALSEIAVAHPEIRAIDVNPLIVGPDGGPVAVDALVVLEH